MFLFLLQYSLVFFVGIFTKTAENNFPLFLAHKDKLKNTYLENINSYKMRENPFELIIADMQQHQKSKNSQYCRTIATWLIPALTLLKEQSIDPRYKKLFFAEIKPIIRNLNKKFKNSETNNPYSTYMYDAIAGTLETNIFHTLILLLLKKDLPQTIGPLLIYNCALFDCVSEKQPHPLSSTELIRIFQKDKEKILNKLSWENTLNKKYIFQLYTTYNTIEKDIKNWEGNEEALKNYFWKHYLKKRLIKTMWAIVLLPLQPFTFFNQQLNKATD